MKLPKEVKVTRNGVTLTFKQRKIKKGTSNGELTLAADIDEGTFLDAIDFMGSEERLQAINGALSIKTRNAIKYATNGDVFTTEKFIQFIESGKDGTSIKELNQLMYKAVAECNTALAKHHLEEIQKKLEHNKLKAERRMNTISGK